MSESNVMILEAKNISKNYGDICVLKNVELKVHAGEVVALLGPNGAGKTTFFYIISGLVHANSGTITLNNTDITAWPVYNRAKIGLGYLPQEASIFRGLNVEDNIFAICEMIEPNHQKALEKTDSLLKEFSIDHLRKSKATALSGGERRRLEIARALATNPKFLLLDEPFAGVDPVAVKDIRHLIGHLTQRGLGIIITDHNVRETLDIIDRGYILYNGEILISGDRETIINDEQVRKFYLGEDFYYRTS
ncbi:MAG: lipopolysaccharide export system ATP-binding protein [Alphaproteobacteria bacterium]|jgi:lipopolysaccharide export system ATP-binding protein